MNTAYYEIFEIDGETAIKIAEKNFYDENHCLDDNGLIDTPLGDALEALGLEESMESIYLTMDWNENRNLTEQEIVSKMFEKGWQLIPFPS